MGLEKVVQIYNSEVYDQIQRYLRGKGDQSILTKEAYEHDIRLFFKTIRGKELEHLTITDVRSITLEEVLDYRSYLKEIKKDNDEKLYANKTINRKITPIKELIKFLSSVKNSSGEYIITDYAYLTLIKTLPEETNHYDVFKKEEVEEIIELALEEKYNPLEKSLYFKFLLNTGLRKTEGLGVKWSDFRDNGDGDTVVVKGIGKGNKSFKKYITNDFYQELLAIKNTKSQYVFDIKVTTIDKTFNRLKDKLNLSPNDGRILTMHSIRKTAGTRTYKLAGNDINLARKFLGHSNVNTTQIYMGDPDEDILISLCTMDKIDKELYNKVELDILVKATREMESDYQLLLNKKIMDILDREA